MTGGEDILLHTDGRSDHYWLSDDALDRLEAGDPSTDDGRWGGDHCIHGTYVGTPGGGDYLCGLCEEGWTYWVKAPWYQLGAVLPGGQWFGIGHQYGDPTDVPMRTLAHMRRAIRTLTPIVDEWQVKVVREGYWTDPYVTIRTDVALAEAPDDAIDIEQAIGAQLRIDSGVVFMDHDTGDVTRKGGAYVITDVEATINRTGLDERTLARIARLEVTT